MPHLAKATVHSPFSILHMGKTEVQELEVDHTVLPGCATRSSRPLLTPHAEPTRPTAALPVSMWQCPMAWMVCWLSPPRWPKNLEARAWATGKVSGWAGSHTFTIWLAVYRAWKLRWLSSPRPCSRVLPLNPHLKQAEAPKLDPS